MRRAYAGVGPRVALSPHTQRPTWGASESAGLGDANAGGWERPATHKCDVTDNSARRPLAVTPMASGACCPSPPGSSVNVDGKILSGLSMKVTTLAG